MNATTPTTLTAGGSGAETVIIDRTPRTTRWATLHDNARRLHISGRWAQDRTDLDNSRFYGGVRIWLDGRVLEFECSPTDDLSGYADPAYLERHAPKFRAAAQ